ncbi:MAG: hypothetical protein QF467_05600, partial [SAR202 cluster bacterium]|nr:hypothetical protein [SAR202 cluster bacterium]
LWKALNGLKPVRPMVIVEAIPWHEMDVDGELVLQTEDDFCRYFETRLRRTLYAWKHMPADMVVEPVVDVPIAIHGVDYGLSPSYRARALGLDVVERTVAIDPDSHIVSHEYEYVDQLATDEDVEKIVNPTIAVDEERTARAEEKAHEIFDGVIAVEMQGYLTDFRPWDRIVEWHGAERTFVDLVERPEFMHKIMSRYTNAYLALVDQMEEQGLLGPLRSFSTGVLGQRGIYLSSPDYTDELPADGFDPARPRPSRSARECWGQGAAQIFAGVSPAMHQEFELDYAVKYYSRFGLAHYGCCDQLHHKIDLLRKSIPNLRRIAMSPLADVEIGAEQIGGDFVFSRQPNPAVFITDSWEPDFIERELREEVDICKRYGCPMDFLMKSISTVRYKPQRLWEWADIAMRVVGDGHA